VARRRNPVGQALIAGALLAFYHFTRLLPLAWCRVLGRLIGRTAYALVPRVWRVGHQNLDLAYGDTLSPVEKKRIVRAAAENMAIVAAEFSHLPWFFRHIDGDWLRIEGAEHWPRDGGVLLVGAHLGNWELMATACRRLGARPAEVVRPLDNPVVNAVVDRTRRGAGVATIPKQHAATEMAGRIHLGEVVGLLADQSPRENGVPVTFFGQPCWATIGPVALAVRTRAPIQPVALTRDPDGGYTFRIQPAIPLEFTGEMHRDLEVNSQRVQDVLEQLVRAHPEQWLWFHRRWKTRDRLAQDWAERLDRAQRRRQTAT
jgi:KDO2-lipid IV(A) lauroyltransferase